MDLPRVLLLAVLATALVAALVLDLRSRRIPNAVTLPALAAALVIRSLTGLAGPQGLGAGLWGAAVAAGPFLIVALRGGMGMGDVKLMAVVGAVLGWPASLDAVLLVAVAGGIQALVATARAGAVVRTLHRARALVLRRGRPAPSSESVTVPYGVSIFAGALLATLRTLIALAILATPLLAGADENIQLGTGSQRVLAVSGGITRIAVGDPDVADARPVGSDQVLVTAGREGRTNLLVWRASGARVAFTIVVRRVSAEQTISEIRALLGGREGIVVRTVGERIFLDGEAFTADDLARVDQITLLYPGVKSLVKISAAARKVLAKSLTESFAQAGLVHVTASVIGPLIFLEGSVESEHDLKKAEVLTRALGEKVENLITVGIKRLVLSEVQFLEVRRSDAIEAGIRWPLEITGTVQATASAGGSLVGVASRTGDVQVAGQAGSSFSFRFAQDGGFARLLAQPRLVCASGEEAEFLAGGEVPIPLLTNQHSSVEYKQYGIILKLKPTADRFGNVATEIEAEVSDVDRSVAVAIGPEQSVPGFRNRRVRTTVTVRDGETIVLSGVLSQDQQKSVARTPLFADVPIVGELFKQRTSLDAERELVIFVTPRIVTPDSERIRKLVGDMKARWRHAGDDVSFGILD